MQEFISRHVKNEPGLSHSVGATIVWDEINGGARPETILLMVLERVQFLQNQLPCNENEHIIHHLLEAIRWEEVRNQHRASQGVQGTNHAHASN